MIFCRIHLGLGDHIATAAIINKLAYDFNDQEIIVPCYAHNHESVVSIFVNVPNIKVEVVNSDADFHNGINTFSLGYYHPIKQNDKEDFVQWFYRQACMSYADRLSWCPVQEAANKVKQVRASDQFEYDFIHDVASNGRFPIEHKTDRITFRPGRHGSILQYVEALKNATEIHCIDSAFFHLVESVETTGKLYYHKVRPDSKNFNPIKNWTVWK